MGEEIDYDHFKKTNKWAIRIEEQGDEDENGSVL